MHVTIMNLVTPKSEAKHEFLFNKPALAYYTLALMQLRILDTYAEKLLILICRRCLISFSVEKHKIH